MPPRWLKTKGDVWWVNSHWYLKLGTLSVWAPSPLGSCLQCSEQQHPGPGPCCLWRRCVFSWWWWWFLLLVLSGCSLLWPFLLHLWTPGFPASRFLMCDPPHCHYGNQTNKIKKIKNLLLTLLGGMCLCYSQARVLYQRPGRFEGIYISEAALRFLWFCLALVYILGFYFFKNPFWHFKTWQHVLFLPDSVGWVISFLLSELVECVVDGAAYLVTYLPELLAKRKSSSAFIPILIPLTPIQLIGW